MIANADEDRRDAYLRSLGYPGYNQPHPEDRGHTRRPCDPDVCETCDQCGICFDHDIDAEDAHVCADGSTRCGSCCDGRC